MYVYKPYTGPLSVQAQYNRSCPIISSSCYNSSLVTWKVLWVTAAKFKPLSFSVRLTYNQIFITVTQLRICWYGALSLTRGQVCRLLLLLALASAVIFGSESRRTRGYISLSHIPDFPFRLHLRLAGLRWRYSTKVKVKVILWPTVSQPVCLGIKHPSGAYDQICYCQTVAGLLIWGALSDERIGLPFTISAGPPQRSHSWVRVPQDWWPYFTVSDSRLPQTGGPGPRIYIPQEQGGLVIPPGTGFLTNSSQSHCDWRSANQ
jgi:hypothetical protein